MMKKISIVTLFLVLLGMTAQAQENTYNMVIEMTDGTKITVGPNDIRSMTFNNGELTVTGVNLEELVEKMATKADVDELRDDVKGNYQFFWPLAEFFNKYSWDTEGIGEALVALLAQLVAKTETPDTSPAEAVDLGLPSGIKWASCNVGATVPEEYGGYYAWGETDEKDFYDWSTYKWCNGTSDSQTKYCTSSEYGTVDNKTVLDPEDDVAHVKWGGDWRMPTIAEMLELIDNCSSEWTSINGVDGRKFTGPNGNSIFLPAAGERWDSSLYHAGSRGYYWSRTLHPYGSDNARDLYFSSGDIDTDSGNRYYGLCVRPVLVQN